VALLGIIRRWHIRDQVPLREIARRLGISRNTVRRYLRSEITEPSYADRRTPSAIDKYALQLSALLKTEAVKSRKQRRTLKQIHQDLRDLGFEGSYDRVAAFARVWRAGQTDRVNSASKRTESVSRLETGGISPSLGRLSTLAGALDFPMEDLLRDTSDHPSDQAASLIACLQNLSESKRALVLRMATEFAAILNNE